MTKQELADRVVKICHVGHNDLGVSREVATACINATMAAIANAVARGEEVTLREFDSFGPKERAAKTARNIGAGILLNIPAHTIPYFKPSNAFKAMVREGKPTNDTAHD